MSISTVQCSIERGRVRSLTTLARVVVPRLRGIVTLVLALVGVGIPLSLVVFLTECLGSLNRI